MRFYEIVVEQMDRAAELLRACHPMESRLALILVDNAVEYALHRYAVDYFESSTPPGAVPIPEKREFYQIQREVCGRYLAPKVAFAEKQGAITSDHASFIRDVHEFRNQAYHAGHAHDPIVSELVATYFAVCCEMLPGLAPRVMRFRMDDAVTPRVSTHVDALSATIMPGADTARAIAASLLEILPDTRRSLAEALRHALDKRLSKVKKLLECLVKNDPRSTDIESLVLDVQFWGEYWGSAPLEGFTFRDNGEGTIAVDPLQEVEFRKHQEAMKDWSPKVSLATLGRWHTRMRELTTETNPGALLQKYRKLDSEMEPFEKMVGERCGAFDRFVEEQMDIARDSRL